MLREKQGIIICGFAGIGKTSIRDAVPSYQKISLYDLSSHAFVKDPGWEKNYVECAAALAKKYDYVFTSTHDVVINELIRRNEKLYTLIVIAKTNMLKDLEKEAIVTNISNVL